MRRRTRISVLTAVLAVSLTGITGQASAAALPLTEPHIVKHLDLAAGDQPENLLFEADGSLLVTMAFAGRIDRLSPDGNLRVLGTLPSPPQGTTVPLTQRAFVGGIVETWDGTIYVTYSAGTAGLTGVWKLPRGGAPVLVAALPAGSVPNGLGQYGGSLYATDSAKGVIWRIPLGHGKPVVWKEAPELTAPGAFAANGLKIHRGAVWVTNMAKGTLLRVPFGPYGKAGAVETKATGIGLADDFTFAGHDDDTLITVNGGNQVQYVRTDGSHTAVLTAADGLQGPTSIARRGNTVVVGSASYFTGVDPNLLAARIVR